jgi:hypothetical protein
MERNPNIRDTPEAAPKLPVISSRRTQHEAEHCRPSRYQVLSPLHSMQRQGVSGKGSGSGRPFILVITCIAYFVPQVNLLWSASQINIVRQFRYFDPPDEMNDRQARWLSLRLNAALVESIFSYFLSPYFVANAIFRVCEANSDKPYIREGSAPIHS